MRYIPTAYCDFALYDFFWIKLKCSFKKIVKIEIIGVAVVFDSCYSDLYIFSAVCPEFFMRKYKMELNSTRLMLSCG